MKEIYKGIYKDDAGIREIEIENNFKTLVTEIDGVIFSGSGFDDLSVDDKLMYTEQQLAGFTFLKTPVYQTDNLLETLCNCLIVIVIPQIIIDKLTNTEFYSDLEIAISLGKPRDEKPGNGLAYEVVTLSLSITGKTYTGASDFFEGAFDKIRNQIKDQYQLKNCYGCMYGDYSVYGQGAFGTMLCFRNQKLEYGKVTNKEEYIALVPSYRNVQEIYCCDEYEARKIGAGYRG